VTIDSLERYSLLGRLTAATSPRAPFASATTGA
jgi:hypothetical protein